MCVGRHSESHMDREPVKKDPIYLHLKLTKAGPFPVGGIVRRDGILSVCAASGPSFRCCCC